MDRARRVLILGGLLLMTTTAAATAQSGPPVVEDASRLPPASRPVKISGDNPTLTAEARAARAQGRLMVRLQVDADGSVSQATLVDSSQMWQYLGPSVQEVTGARSMCEPRRFSTCGNCQRWGWTNS